MSDFVVVPMSVKRANALVTEWHRHLDPVRIALWAVAVARVSDGQICGAAIVEIPKAGRANDGRTCEITRLVTDGTPNACSKLYATVRRVAFIMGYTRVLTYTLPDESGASLRAAGFLFDGCTRGGSWSRKYRPRTDKHPTCPKSRWVARTVSA